MAASDTPLFDQFAQWPLRSQSATISWATIQRRFTGFPRVDYFLRWGTARLGWMRRLRHLETFPDVDAARLLDLF
jgi:hypothetical protein